jgi:hypothetical protein
MKKPLVILLYTFGITSAAFASSFDGFYTGAAIGGSFTHAHLSGAANPQYSDSSLNFLNSVTLSLPVDLHKNSVAGDIHIGYGHQLGQSPLYLGAEVFGDFVDRQMNNTQNNMINEYQTNPFPTPFTHELINNVSTTTDVKLNIAEFGVDLHPGVLLGQNTLLSAIVGVAFNKLQLSSNNMQVTTRNPVFFPSSPINTSTLLASTSKNVAALRLGGEVKEHFNNHWALNADYIYMDYGKISTNALGTINTIDAHSNPTVLPNAFTTNASANVTSNTVMLGLDYYFTANSVTATRLTNTAFVSPFNGFYAGAAAGASFTQADLSGSTSTQFNDNGFFGNTTNSLPPASHKNSATGDIHLGYGLQFGQSPLYLGAEVFGDFADRQMNNTQHDGVGEMDAFDFTPPAIAYNNSVSIATNVKLNTAEFGVDLHPGVLFGQNTLITAIVGVAFNKLQISTNNMQVTTFNPNFTHPIPQSSATLLASESKNVAALRLGGEVQEHFNNHWALSADYIYTDYGKINTSAIGNINAFDVHGNPVLLTNAFTTNVTANVHSNSVMLGLNYYFCGNQAA